MAAATRSITVGLIGCGAVAELYHLPALQRILPRERIWLADSNPERASLLGEAIGLSDHAVTDYRELIGVIDAAIVAVPNDLHVPVGIDLLAQGIHVLCEKPLATTAEDGERLVAASSGGAILCVGNVRRFFPSTRFLKDLLQHRLYGRPLSFEAEDGVPFAWPTASAFFLDRGRAGGGVLMDAGAHVLDQLLLWFGEDVEIRAYADDSHGGVESECTIEVVAGPVTGTVELSRTRRLRNAIRVECERGSAEIPLSELADRVVLTSKGDYTLELDLPDESMRAHEAELRDFLAQVDGEPGIGASGADGLRILRLIEECYAGRQQLDGPWVTRTLHRGRSALDDRFTRILVTGASGFLGCRLCEQLRLGYGASVRAMVHRPERAMRLARLDVELIQADLADPATLARAAEGCDAVVHCAIGGEDAAPEQYRFLTGKAAGAVAEAALQAGVKRFVHLSSVAVHGYSPPEREIDEETPVRFTGDAYADAKIEAEDEIRARIARGLPAVILRPTNIYGPFSTIFTVNPLEALKQGHVALAGDGSGPANTAYVDNVIDAIVLALTSEEALGECFVVSDEDGTTWRGLYEAYARLISPSCGVRSVPMEALYPTEAEPASDEATESNGRASRLAAVRRLAVDQPVLRALGRSALSPFPRTKDRLFEWLAPAAPGTVDEAPPPAPETIFAPDEIPTKGFAEIQTSGVLFRAEKARNILGYRLRVPFEVGIALTGEWLRFWRLI